MTSLFKQRGLIVSCQALPNEPLHGDRVMARMAIAAKEGGAIGIRANGPDDIRAIRREVDLPIIGLNKRDVTGSDIYITPGMEDVRAVLEAGADIVALDATDRENRLEAIVPMIEYIHRSGAFVMADISTLEEGIKAARLGVDFVSTTLSGYTPYSRQQEEPDLELVRELSERVQVPVVAEGRIWSPQDAVRALEAGAQYVVVGSAITRPQLITMKYAEQLANWLAARQDSAVGNS